MKSIGIIIYMVGFILSITIMLISEVMGITDNLHTIECCITIFIAGAIISMICELLENKKNGDNTEREETHE